MYNEANPISQSDVVLKKQTYDYRVLECTRGQSKSSGRDMLTFNGEIINAEPINVKVTDASGDITEVTVDINGIEIPCWQSLEGKDSNSDRTVKRNVVALAETYDFANPYSAGFDANMLVGKMFKVVAETVTEANKDSSGQPYVS